MLMYYTVRLELASICVNPLFKIPKKNLKNKDHILFCFFPLYSEGLRTLKITIKEVLKMIVVEKHQFDFAPGFVGIANIKVVGVGGGGGNAINRMIASDLKGVEFVAVNTDAQALEQNRAEKCVQVGAQVTNGLGAGANPEVGRLAMEESRTEVAAELGSPNLVFITVGMGGGTGTGAAPIVAETGLQPEEPPWPRPLWRPGR